MYEEIENEIRNKYLKRFNDDKLKLETEKAQLAKEAEQLKLQAENQEATLAAKLRLAKATLEEEAIKKAALEMQFQLEGLNKELTEKVTIASALKVQNVKVAAITSKGKLKEDHENAYKAKRIEKIKVAYTLLPNPLAKQEEKEVIVRVLDPEGAVLTNGMDGSAFYSAGKELMYTGKQKVAYTNTNQDVEWVFAKGGDRYRPGKYNVELYAEGFKIGEGNFTVR